MSNSWLDFFLRIRLPIIIFTALAAFALTYFIARPERDGIGNQPDQPILFTHALHADSLKIDCQYCHTDVEKGRHASIPSANMCMNCHTLARKDRPEILKLADYYKNNKPILWNRVHKVPDYAYFSHAAHLAAGIQCVSCHGNVQTMTKISQVNSFTMGSCLDCHRKSKEKLPYLTQVKIGPENCWACHR